MVHSSLSLKKLNLPTHQVVFYFMHENDLNFNVPQDITMTGRGGGVLRKNMNFTSKKHFRTQYIRLT